MNHYVTTFTITSVLSMRLLPGCENKNGKEPVKPNILFILIDDLGKEWLNTYGSGLVETPAIDKLASTGLKFNNAYSMPQCTPSRVSLLTGQYPFRNGWVNHYDVPRWGHGARFDPKQNPSLPKLMQEAGYTTCIAGKWQINDFRLEPDILSEVGFDEYCMWTGGEGGNEEVSSKRYWDPYIHTREGSKTYHGLFGEDIFSDFIISFMKKHKDEPMFVYYPMNLTHGPLTTTPLEPDAPMESQHQAMVRYTDFILGKLVTALEDLDIRENTIIIWTTDNGTAPGITGSRYNKAVQGGKTYLTENGVNAPFIANCPGLVPEGMETNELVDFTDILPTLAELAHINPDPGFDYDGKSFAGLLLGQSKDSGRDWALSMGSHPARIVNGRLVNSFRYRDRVIMYNRYKAYVDTTGKIYEIIDLKNDFYEVNNLMDQANPETEQVLDKFNSILSTIPPFDANPLYQKFENSLYNIPEQKLLKISRDAMNNPNKSPLPKTNSPDMK